MKKICVVTGSRAEYGLLKHLMFAIKKSSLLRLQLIVTGSHLSANNGYTVREIEADLFHIDKSINLQINGDTPINVSDSTSIAISGIARSIDELKPDLLLVLGDRYEILAAAIAALYSGVPVGHIHGGEVTEGAIDDAIRHSITKMSHLHFVANSEYQKRVMQLGEDPGHIYVVGGLGVDAISKIKLLTKLEVEKKLGIEFANRNLLVTYHPETINTKEPDCGIDQLLLALKELDSCVNLIFTMPNVDIGNQYVREKINAFNKQRKKSFVFESMGQLLYLSAMANCDAVVGNSSSGLLEAPVMGKRTINIGSRQNGRLKASSVIDCLPSRSHILAAIKSLYGSHDADNFEFESPYGTPGASERIVQTLESIDFSCLISKKFMNMQGFYDQKNS